MLKWARLLEERYTMVRSWYDGAMCRVSGDTLHVKSSIGVIKTHEKNPNI